MEKKKVVVAITGASGAIYAKVLLEKLAASQDQLEAVGLLMSSNAKTVWECELGDAGYENLPFRFYDKHDFNAPFASGSARFQTMIICPCSMGTL